MLCSLSICPLYTHIKEVIYGCKIVSNSSIHRVIYELSGSSFEQHIPSVPSQPPLTPPTTPRKRKSSESCSSVSGSPGHSVKRLCTPKSLFRFENLEDHASRVCEQELNESVIWQVSAHIHSNWKAVGRTLNVPEVELMCIEHAHKDLRECSFQMLLKWKDMFPRNFRYGVLYSALCDAGLKSHALKYVTLSQ